MLIITTGTRFNTMNSHELSDLSAEIRFDRKIRQHKIFLHGVPVYLMAILTIFNFLDISFED